MIARGLAVTWNNPDIELQKDGQAVNSWDLDPDTEYDILARIWNNSTEAPVVGLPVRFSYLGFGVGTVSHPVGLTSINLGVKGGHNHPAFARTKWRTPSAAGHYCLQVILEPSDDVNELNNIGQENTNVGKLKSPAVITFLLRNTLPTKQLFRFEVDTYVIPDPPPCSAQEFGSSNGISRRVRSILQVRSTGAATPSLVAHQRGRHPIPPGWSVEITPSTPLLASGDEITVQVTVISPSEFKGYQAFNVNAFNDHELAGGVTLRVESD